MRLFPGFLLLSLVLAAGCAGGPETWPPNTAVQPAAGLPDRFQPADSTAGPGSADTAAGACRSPLRDPRRGTEIRLVRSSGGYGDYAAPPGIYGLQENQLIRLDCRTSGVLGAVPR